MRESNGEGTVPEQIIAIYPDRLGETLDILRQLPQVAEAAVFGDGIHVAAAHAEGAKAALEQALASRGIVIGRIQSVEPSLEDAFISLIQRAEGR